MAATNNKSRLPKVRNSLRLRLTTAVVLSVLLVTGVGMLLDYRREYRIHMDQVRGSLTEQAQALRVARRQINDPKRFARYVTDFCAQMNESISPGHHVLVLGTDGGLVASAYHHGGLAVQEALLAAGDSKEILSVSGHRIAQVRLEDDEVTIVLAQYLDNVEGILRRQLISRAATTAAMALAIIVLIFIAMHFWAIRPIEELAGRAQAWSARDFSARAGQTGPSEIRLLSREFNAMAETLERHERNRTAELQRARQIQASLLPASVPFLRGLSVVADYRPVEYVAGDLYDVFELPNETTAFAILDVAGHGITAALLTGVVKMSLHRRLMERSDPAEAITLVNQDLLDCISEGQFVTACVGIWNPADKSWTYCGAGHTGGVMLTRQGSRHLSHTGPLLGIMAEAQWSSETIQLAPGDRLFLYTDGVVDAGAPSDRLGSQGLAQLLLQSSEASLEDQVARVMEDVVRRSNGKPDDDLTVVGLEVHPAGSA